MIGGKAESYAGGEIVRRLGQVTNYVGFSNPLIACPRYQQHVVAGFRGARRVFCWQYLAVGEIVTSWGRGASSFLKSAGALTLRRVKPAFLSL